MARIEDGFYETNLRNMPIELCYVQNIGKKTIALFPDSRRWPVLESGIWPYIKPSNLTAANSQKYVDRARELIRFIEDHAQTSRKCTEQTEPHYWKQIRRVKPSRVCSSSS